jgi:hypothetical protein
MEKGKAEGKKVDAKNKKYVFWGKRSLRNKANTITRRRDVGREEGEKRDPRQEVRYTK